MNESSSVTPSTSSQRSEKASAVNLAQHYDFIVCGSGSSGSVVARRLSDNPDVSVLLLEAGPSDNVPAVQTAAMWPVNLGSERDWNFAALPSPHLNGRSIPLNMGKVLGGGSSINVMAWSRGHKSDWDFYAAEAGEAAWGYDAVVNLYRRIEDWHGVPDPAYRGVGGLVHVQPARTENPLFRSFIAAAGACGIPEFASPNGRMQESSAGAAIQDVRLREGTRFSVFRSYVYPVLDRPNLTVATGTLVTRVLLEGKRAVGVEILREGRTEQVLAGQEVVLSLGAINTPKVLMLSGIGDESELKKHGIATMQHLPGVGRNYQDHAIVSMNWETNEPMNPSDTMNGGVAFASSTSGLDAPDMQFLPIEIPLISPENIALHNPTMQAWSLCALVTRPQAFGRVRLAGTDPALSPEIETGMFAHPDDLKAYTNVVKLGRAIGNSSELRPFSKKEVLPGDLAGAHLESYIRNAAITCWHQTCTAKMGRDADSVVDAQLRVYGIENLRIADGSILPRVTTGNTMAPCVVIGERAAEFITAERHL